VLAYKSMRCETLLLACLGLIVPVLRGAPITVFSSPADLALAVQHAEDSREASVLGLVSTRRYVLRNKRWDEDAVMVVRMISEPKTGKRFEIVAADNVHGLQRRALMKILEAEVETSRKAKATPSTVTPDNYDFSVIGKEVLDGRECIVLQLTPKVKSKLLLNGKAWVDAEEQAIVQIEGRTAANVSFWIGKPYVLQRFKKVDQIWLSAHNRSVSDVKLLGRTELMIDYLFYEIAHHHQQRASAP
jgi:hypothetical protein